MSSAATLKERRSLLDVMPDQPPVAHVQGCVRRVRMKVTEAAEKARVGALSDTIPKVFHRTI